MSSSFKQMHFVHVQASGQMEGYLVLVTAGLTWISLIFKKCVFTFSGGFQLFLTHCCPHNIAYCLNICLALLLFMNNVILKPIQ